MIEDPLQLDKDLVWLRPLGLPQTMDEVQQGVLRKFPEVTDMKEDGWEALEVSKKRRSIGKEVTGSTVCIHVGEVGKGKERFEDLLKLKEHLEGLQKTNAVIVNAKKEETEELRKMLQGILYKSDIVVDIYIGRKSEPAKRIYRNDAILIKADGREYVEALKKVKEGLSRSPSEITVKGIRKTKNGDVLVEIHKGDNSSQITDICSNLGDLQVTVLKQKATTTKKYLIGNLDAVVTEQEVLLALQNTATGDEDRESAKVTSLRAANNGTQSAVVHIEERWARRLMQLGGIRIGMVICGISEWINVDRCYRCWGYDHIARECSGPDRTKACLKCGGEGHEAAACDNPLYCPLCQQAGHRAGSGACPKMRRILRRLKEQKSPKRK